MAGKQSEQVVSTSGQECGTRLGLWGWILTVSRILSITFKLAWKIAKAPFTSRNGFSMYKYAVYQGMLDYQCGLDAASIQHILTPTAKTCASIAKKHRIPHRLLHLKGGAVASRLGGEDASKALLYFHGGGYMATALPHHVFATMGFGKSLPEGMAVFILHYSLASETGNHYPLQVQQAVSLLDHVLHKENIPTASTSLAGDSAGAHLIISLLLHLSHPSPQVPQLSISGKLSSAALISPWIINPNSDADSLTSNTDKDIIEKSAIEYWIRNFLGPLDCSEPRPWALPLTAPQSWWTDLKIGEILVLYGQNEVLRDDAARFCELLKAGHAQAETVEVEGELHTHLILNRFLYINEACESERLYLEWYKRHT